jgi:hypothetical protein
MSIRKSNRFSRSSSTNVVLDQLGGAREYGRAEAEIPFPLPVPCESQRVSSDIPNISIPAGPSMANERSQSDVL